MKLYRKFLRLWVTAASLFGFLTGWIFLSHIPDIGTVTAANGSNTSIALTNLPSVPSLSNSVPAVGSVQTFTFTPNTAQNQSGFSTFLRTGGS